MSVGNLKFGGPTFPEIVERTQHHFLSCDLTVQTYLLYKEPKILILVIPGSFQNFKYKM